MDELNAQYYYRGDWPGHITKHRAKPEANDQFRDPLVNLRTDIAFYTVNRFVTLPRPIASYRSVGYHLIKKREAEDTAMPFYDNSHAAYGSQRGYGIYGFLYSSVYPPDYHWRYVSPVDIYRRIDSMISRGGTLTVIVKMPEMRKIRGLNNLSEQNRMNSISGSRFHYNN